MKDKLWPCERGLHGATSVCRLSFKIREAINNLPAAASVPYLSGAWTVQERPASVLTIVTADRLICSLPHPPSL